MEEMTTKQLKAERLRLNRLLAEIDAEIVSRWANGDKRGAEEAEAFGDSYADDLAEIEQLLLARA